MSKIQWTEKTWNPVAGCSLVSAGCKNCYAMTMAGRLEAMGQQKYVGLTKREGGRTIWTGKIAFDEKALLEPLRRKVPTMYFVNSMSDLFHESITDEQIDRIFAAMALCPQHTFQVLTKRPRRMKRYMALTESYVKIGNHEVVNDQQKGPGNLWVDDELKKWPLPNVWLGVSCENQETADERIPLLLETPATVRFISAEPLLGIIDLTMVPVPGPLDPDTHCNVLTGDMFSPRHGMNGFFCAGGLNWVIVGGESGPGARPCNVEWIRSIADQCKAAGVACFVKQLGAKPYDNDGSVAGSFVPTGSARLKDRKGGDINEWPEDLRVRQMPAVSA